jgi:hypothetical protein
MRAKPLGQNFDDANFPCRIFLNHPVMPVLWFYGGLTQTPDRTTVLFPSLYAIHANPNYPHYGF